MYSKRIVNEKDADKVDDGDDSYKPNEIIRFQKQLHQLLIVAGNHHVLDIFHELDGRVAMYRLSSRLQISQTFLEVDCYIVLWSLFMLLIFLIEKFRLRMLGKAVRLINIKQIVEINIWIFDRGVVIHQRFSLRFELLLVSEAQLQFVFTVEIDVHSSF